MVLMIVSGRSGSGKSVALRALEDMGFYCVDNLPVVLLPELARSLADRNISAAVSIDVRNMPESPEIFEQAMKNLPEAFSPQLLFLDADRNTLIRRYSDTRRLHPLSSKNLSLESAIDEESALLEPLRSRADLIVDTSEMSVHELAEMLRTRLLGKRERELTMVFESFGFKHGIPIDADYVFDVRFLPNPHWDPKLRPMTGLDKPVAAFLDRHTEVHNFIYQTRSYLELWLPMLETNNRSYLTVAIGCTGGKHRSVYIAEQLADYFRSRGKNVQSRHRTLEKTQIMTVKQIVEITNKLGMHARPAMKLFELMQNYDAEVLLRNDEGTEAEANSVIALLMLDSAKGRQIEIEANGPQEVEALAAVIALFNAGFDED
ncbi:glmZ(sRNA)-inactivating NTPase [Raoultella ornithinolytica]|nr:glmZ(sRNA)-inactivating NTPase [Raoultella ornithinolytica]